MKDLPIIRGRRFIAEAVAEGEHEHQDFKYAITDARKIARSVSAFANAGGGRLLIGVKDNGVAAGVRNEEDVYMVETAASHFCDPPQHVEFTAFRVDPGVVVIRAEIAQAAQRPVRVLEADGSKKAYYRVADENIVAHPLMVRAWESSAPVSLNLDGDAMRLLEILRSDANGFDVRSLALRLHSSVRRVESLVTDLAIVGAVTFIYRHPEFRITAASAD